LCQKRAVRTYPFQFPPASLLKLKTATVEFNLRFCVVSFHNSFLVYLSVDLGWAPGLSLIVAAFSWWNFYVTLIDHCVLGPIGCDSALVGKARCRTDALEVNLFGRIWINLCGRLRPNWWICQSEIAVPNFRLVVAAVTKLLCARPKSAFGDYLATKPQTVYVDMKKKIIVRMFLAVSHQVCFQCQQSTHFSSGYVANKQWY